MVRLIQVCSRYCLLALSSIMVFCPLLSPSSSESPKPIFLRLHCQLGSVSFYYIFLAVKLWMKSEGRREVEELLDWGSGFSTCHTAALVSLVELSTTPPEDVFLEHRGIGGVVSGVPERVVEAAQSHCFCVKAAFLFYSSSLSNTLVMNSFKV